MNRNLKIHILKIQLDHSTVLTNGAENRLRSLHVKLGEPHHPAEDGEVYDGEPSSRDLQGDEKRFLEAKATMAS